MNPSVSVAIYKGFSLFFPFQILTVSKCQKITLTASLMVWSGNIGLDDISTLMMLDLKLLNDLSQWLHINI